MRLFSKKNRKSPDYILKSQEIKLILNTKKFNPEKPHLIPCFILSSDNELITFLGDRPFRLNNPSFTLFTHLRDGLFYINHEKITFAKTIDTPFSHDSIHLIEVTLTADDVIPVLNKGIIKGIFSFDLFDKSFSRISVSFNVDIHIFLEQIQKFLSEGLRFGKVSAKLEEYHTNIYLRKLSFDLIFEDGGLLVKSFSRDFQVHICFQDNTLLEDIRLQRDDFHYEKPETNQYTFLKDTIPVTIPDPASFIKKVHNALHGKIILQTNNNIFEQLFICDITALKKYAIQHFYKHFTEWDKEDLMLVSVFKKEHYTKIVGKKLFGPKVMYASPGRPSIHFTLNHVVGSHMYGSWEDTDCALLLPFDQTLAMNTKTVYGGTTVDFFFIGYLRLPKNITLINRHMHESWDQFVARINDTIYASGLNVMPPGTWAWGGSWEVTSWWNMFCKKYHFVAAPHTNTEWMNLEHRAYSALPDKKTQLNEYGRSVLFREKFLELCEKDHHILFFTYKKALHAWHSYWNKMVKNTNKIKEEIIMGKDSHGKS